MKKLTLFCIKVQKGDKFTEKSVIINKRNIKTIKIFRFVSILLI